MFPVHIKYPGTTVPESGPCFIIAREGMLLRRETSWMRAVVPVSSIGVLESEPIGVESASTGMTATLVPFSIMTCCG